MTKKSACYYLYFLSPSFFLLLTFSSLSPYTYSLILILTLSLSLFRSNLSAVRIGCCSCSWKLAADVALKRSKKERGRSGENEEKFITIKN